jgi:chromate transporter
LLYAYGALVRQRSWLTPEGWSENWALCQMAPGISLIALAASSGYRLVGLSGAAASIAGLMAPSIVITVLMAAFFQIIGNFQIVKAGIHGVVMAAAAGSILTAIRIARPLFQSSAGDGASMVAMSALTVPVCALLVFSGLVPVFAILLGAGFAMSAALPLSRLRIRPKQP